MCIRDRPCNADPTLIHPVLQETGQWASMVHPPDQSGADPCLLYTSDAADERSSVDLGGRRIIKKKKMV